MGKTLNCNQWCAVSFGALFSFSQVQDVACVGVQIAWFMCAFKICVASCVGGQCVWVWDLNPNNRIGSGHLRPILFTTTAKFLLFYFLVVDLFSLPILDLPACLFVTYMAPHPWLPCCLLVPVPLGFFSLVNLQGLQTLAVALQQFYGCPSWSLRAGVLGGWMVHNHHMLIYLLTLY